MVLRRDIFQALADPTRRAILLLLASHTLSAGAIAEHFNSARSTISKHVQILLESDLIEAKSSGREIFYRIKVERINEVEIWLQQLRGIYTESLDKLDAYLINIQKRGKTDDE